MCVCMSLNKFVCPLCIPTILNRFLKSLVFWNLHVPKIVQFYFHKDICSFEAAMASEASGNVCFILASNVCTWDCIERLRDLHAKRSVSVSVKYFVICGRFLFLEKLKYEYTSFHFFKIVNRHVAVDEK